MVDWVMSLALWQSPSGSSYVGSKSPGGFCRSRVSNDGFSVQEYKCLLQKSGSSIAGSESPGILVQIPKVQEVLVGKVW